MCAVEATISDPLAESIQSLATDFRALVASIQKPALTDSAWMKSIQQRCQNLSDRFDMLREAVASRRQNLADSLGEIRASLQTYAKDLPNIAHPGSIKKMQAVLVRRYEDFVEQVKDSKLWNSKYRPRFRSLRLPKAARSIFHMTSGVAGVVLYQFMLARSTAIAILGSLLSIFFILEVSRRFSERFNDFMVYKLFGAISRPQERYKTNSASYYLLALTIITILTPKPAVCAAALVLAFGDPMAAMAGGRWGKIRLSNDKSIIGALAFFGAAFLAVIAYLAIVPLDITTGHKLMAAGSMAAVGALVELFSHDLDDNFTIPVACALVGLLWF